MGEIAREKQIFEVALEETVKIVIRLVVEVKASLTMPYTYCALV